jgi:hypothetical protein
MSCIVYQPGGIVSIRSRKIRNGRRSAAAVEAPAWIITRNKKARYPKTPGFS